MSTFSGYPKQALAFFASIAKHNNRTWYEQHKQEYIDNVLEPSVAFTELFGAELRKMSPGLHVDSRTSGAGSIKRIYRDVRFSKDKTPYKTRLGIVFWEGDGGKKESPMVYFHMGTDGAKIIVGMHHFPPALLKAYRTAVDDTRQGAKLERILLDINSMRGYSVSDPHYKRVPRGFDAEHPRSDLLRHNGIFGMSPVIPPSIVTSSKLIPRCVEHTTAMMPLHKWMVRVDSKK